MSFIFGTMDEIRIYYECLEQARHFVAPMVENALRAVPKDCRIRFVRRASPAEAEKSGNTCLRAIHSLITPDALLTGVAGGREYPLVLFEFSEAVLTEDHELQKTYGACAAWLADMFYVKISGAKQSAREFGGAKYNPYSTPRIMGDNLGFDGCIYAEWPTHGTDAYNLQTGKRYLSCPPDIALAGETVSAAIAAFGDKPQGWFERSQLTLAKTSAHQLFRAKTDKAPGAEGILSEWARRSASNPARSRFFVGGKKLSAKINRFSHAMDPDRGVLTFMSMVFSGTHKIFGVYALERQHSLRGSARTIGDIKKRLRIAAEKDGLPAWLRKLFFAKADKAAMEDEIDCQDAWDEHHDQIRGNKVIKTLAYFLDGLRLNHNGPLFVWDRSRLLGRQKGESLADAMRRRLDFSGSYNPVSVTQVAGEMNEDEVTYALVHCVLLPSEFRLLAVSYPGAQGGTPVLPEPRKGKSQPREYLDVMAEIPGGNGVLLNESKGKFSRNAVEKDVQKLRCYQTEAAKRGALTRTLREIRLLGENDEVHNILVGVSFAVEPDAPVAWRPDEVDFIFMLAGRRRWRIGVFSDALAGHIRSHGGATALPEVFRVVADSKDATSLLD